MTNTAAVGAGAGILGLSLERLEDVIKDRFATKGERVIQPNLAVAKEAYQMAVDRYRDSFSHSLHDQAPPRSSESHGSDRPMLISGNELFRSAQPQAAAASSRRIR